MLRIGSTGANFILLVLRFRGFLFFLISVYLCSSVVSISGSLT
jgi:hypothetical protein